MARKRSRRKNKTRRRKQRGGSSGPVVFTLTNQAGFGSVTNFICHAYIHAKETGKDFFIEHDNWQYTYKNGWHDYFKSLKLLPNPPPTDLVRFKHPIMNSIPAYSMKKYTNCIKEIFVLNDDIAKKAQDYIDTMGTPYKAVYIRMGDKVFGNDRESYIFPVSEIVKLMELPENSKLFLMTDDYSIKGEIEKLVPTVKIYTLTPPESRGASAHDLRALPKEEMRKHAEELFMSMQIVMKAEKAWVWNHSNLGRFMKMGSPENIILYPDNKTLTEDSIVDPAHLPL